MHGLTLSTLTLSTRECLNRELFGNLHEARVILESWRVEYNERRPHSSLGYQTPNEYACRRTNRFDWGCAPQTPRRSPRQAFGGNSGSTPQGGKQTKTKTLRNPQTSVMKCLTRGVTP